MFFAGDGNAPSCLRINKGFNNLQKTVDRAPEDVGQTAAVPESTHQKGDKEVQAVAPLRHPVAAEGNVDIVPEPCGQRNVPAAPKFLDGKGEVRAFKVCGKINPEKFCAADGDIRVAREIAVNFNRKHDCDNDKNKPDITVRIVINLIDDAREDVRDHKLFEVPPRHQLQPVGRILIVKTPLLLKLRQKCVRPAYGTGEKLREKGDEKGIVAEVPFRPKFSFVNVDQISQRLEKIKGDACRQQDLQGKGLQCQPPGIDQGVDAIDCGSAQLEDQKDCHKGQDAAQKTEPFLIFIRRFFQSQSQKVSENRGKKEQKPVGCMQIHVKSIACRQQERPSEFDGHDMVQDEYRQQKDGKSHGIK